MHPDSKAFYCHLLGGMGTAAPCPALKFILSLKIPEMVLGYSLNMQVRQTVDAPDSSSLIYSVYMQLCHWAGQCFHAAGCND